MSPVLQLAISLAVAAIDGIPKIIAAISASSMTAEEKAKALADLRARLLSADAKVAAVTFRDVDEQLRAKDPQP